MYYLLGGVTLSRLKFKNKYIKIIVMSLCLILPLGLGSIIYKLNSKVSEIEAIKIDEKVIDEYGVEWLNDYLA